MPDNADLPILRREATTTGSSIRTKCKRAVAQDFPDQHPEHFLEAIHRIASLLGGEVEAVSSDETILYTDRVRRVRSLVLHLRQVSEWVRFADSAQTSQTPWSIIGPLKRLFAPLIENCEFIVRPKWHWNYGVLRGIPTYLLNDVLSAVEERPQNATDIAFIRDEVKSWGANAAVISFPYLDRKNVLRHILFAHEIGHLVADRCLTKYWTDSEHETKRFLHEKILKKLQADPALSGQPFLGFATLAELEKAHWFLRRAAEEILADLTAVWVFGPVAVFAAHEIAVERHLDIAPSDRTNGYPPWRFRLHEMLAQCEASWPTCLGLGESDEELARDVHKSVNQGWLALKSDAQIAFSSYAPLQEWMLPIVYAHLRETVLPAVVREQKRYVLERLPQLKHDARRLTDLLIRLENKIPPNNVTLLDGEPCTVDVADVREIFLAGWLLYLHRRSCEPGFPGDAQAQDRLQRLLLKAIECAELEARYRRWKPTREDSTGELTKPVFQGSVMAGCLDSDPCIGEDPMNRARDGLPTVEGSGMLSKADITKELGKRVSEGLVITPCLDRKSQIGEGSLDIRLANEFIVMKRAELTHFEVLREESSFQKDLSRYMERIRKRRGHPFVLHPDEFVLGASLEYLSVPTGLYAQVIGKSSLGRLGLVIATATGVHPGFKGCLTLELCNLGKLPIQLHPGIPIAQLVFFRLKPGGAYAGRYDCPTGPQFSKLSVEELPFWKNTSG